MKLLWGFLLFAAVFAVSVQTRPLPNLIQRIRDLIERGRQALNQQIINFFERERENFSTGWPSLGIPPIDPLYIEDIEAEIDSIGTLTSIDFRLFDANLRGLQQFEIETIDLRIFGLRVEFAFFFRQLVIDGQHSTRASLAGLPINGAGTISMVFNDIRVRGEFDIGTITGGFLNLNQAGFHLNVGSVNANLRGFGIFIDPTINLLLSAGLPVFINEGEERINEVVAETLIPAINEVLNQYRVIDLILAIITGGFPNASPEEVELLTEILKHEFNGLELQ